MFLFPYSSTLLLRLHAFQFSSCLSLSLMLYVLFQFFPIHLFTFTACVSVRSELPVQPFHFHCMCFYFFPCSFLSLQSYVFQFFFAHPFHSHCMCTSSFLFTLFTFTVCLSVLCIVTLSLLTACISHFFLFSSFIALI